jgi:uncharacterized protein YgbK (DUF1537 family)
VPLLADADIAFKKVDSLFRGPWAEELAACFRRGHWRHCILAPAFPHHGRHTRGGRQFARSEDGSWHPAGGDLADALSVLGVPAIRGVPGEALPEGIIVFDAETDADLDAIVSMAQQVSGPILWCGTGGLARALAHGRQVAALRKLESPVLGFFGSDQPLTKAQLEACGSFWIRTMENGDEIAAVRRMIEATGVALLSVDLPAGLDRSDAAERIRKKLGQMAAELPMPGTLIVAGGETLRGLCGSLGTASLQVTGQVAPGVPRSVMHGGRWNGVSVISKSGAFGGANLWRDLLMENNLIVEGMRA